MARTSRFPGFYKVTVARAPRARERRDGRRLRATSSARSTAGGLDAETADKFVENVLGHLRAALRRRAQRPRQRPRSRRPDGHRGAERRRRGIERREDGPRGRRLRGRGRPAAHDRPDRSSATCDDARGRGRARSPPRAGDPARSPTRPCRGLVARGGGARDVEARVLGRRRSHASCTSSSTARTRWARTSSTRVAERGRRSRSRPSRAGASACASSRTSATSAACACTCRVPASVARDRRRWTASDVIDGIVNASRFAELDPYRAATHNKGIMNGIDAVVIATGNDWRAVEAGRARVRRALGPLLAAGRRGDARATTSSGRLELPLALGTVGGTLRVHPAARLSLRMLGVDRRAGARRDRRVRSASRRTSPPFAPSRPTASSAATWALHARSVALAAGAPSAPKSSASRR